ncbi:MAG: type II secretion system major pseudopilin GspG [Bacteriovoracaceae bacterium]|jgi:general secretion pathway protein G|nr:type II secretion system major pseudopilin GspG [Bacteriovoracaceae bacterium]
MSIANIKRIVKTITRFTVNKKIKMNPLKSSQSGFSLVEILVALTLLGIAGTFVAGKIFDSLLDGQIQSTRIQMNAFKARLQEFRRKCGYYPTTDQGLESLISKPTSGRECTNYPPNGFIEGDELPQDPWNSDYVYSSDGKKFDIMSYGPDQEEGGEGADQDIFLSKKSKSRNE